MKKLYDNLQCLIPYTTRERWLIVKNCGNDPSTPVQDNHRFLFYIKIISHFIFIVILSPMIFFSREFAFY